MDVVQVQQELHQVRLSRGFDVPQPGPDGAIGDSADQDIACVGQGIWRSRGMASPLRVKRPESFEKGGAERVLNDTTSEYSSRFEGIAWVPLRVKLPENKVSLIVGLAKLGVFNRPEMCELVARELSIQDPLLVEHALTRFIQSPVPLPDAVYEEIIEIWSTQLLGLISIAMRLKGPSPRPDSILQGEGAITIPSLSSATSKCTASDLEALAERLVMMVGRAAVSHDNPSAVRGLLQAWTKAAAPSLVAHLGLGSLLRLLKHNAHKYEASFSGADSDHSSLTPLIANFRQLTTQSNFMEAQQTQMERTAHQLEAIVAGLAKLAWHLPSSTDALKMFGNLVKLRTKEMSFSKTYLRKGSKLRDQAKLGAPICDSIIDASNM